MTKARRHLMVEPRIDSRSARVTLTEAWTGDRFVRARRAATGDPAHAGDICGRCSANENFVPTPDRDDEPLDAAAVDEVAGALTAHGLPPADEVRQALVDRLEDPRLL